MLESSQSKYNFINNIRIFFAYIMHIDFEHNTTLKRIVEKS